MRTTLHVVYTRRTKQTIASTIVTKVPAWIRQWAAKLLKKQIATYAKTYWNLVNQASVVPHTSAWILDTWRAAHACLHYTHVHNPCQLLCGQHTHTARPRSTHWATHTSIYTHTFFNRLTEVVTFLQMQVTPPNLKWQPPVACIKSQCKWYLLYARNEGISALHKHTCIIMNCVGRNIQNTNFQRDSDEFKGCSKGRHPCTACLDGPNHFGSRPTWQLTLASLQASLHTHTPPPPRTQLQVCIMPWNFDMV